VGHHGIIILLAAVTQTFWWPNMKRTIQHYVRNCVTCQRNKATRHKPYGLLQSHEVPTMPFEHVSFELITDLPECDGYDAVVVFVCIAYETDDYRANYKNDYRGGISEGYAPRCFPAFWLTTEINIRSRSPVY
jgi:hypothetical protein